MTAYAWWVTTWGRIRETLQPELWALRKALRIEIAKRETAERRALQNYDKVVAEGKRAAKAEHKLMKLQAEVAAMKKALQDGAAKKKRIASAKRNRLPEGA